MCSQKRQKMLCKCAMRAPYTSLVLCKETQHQQIDTLDLAKPMDLTHCLRLPRQCERKTALQSLPDSHRPDIQRPWVDELGSFCWGHLKPLQSLVDFIWASYVVSSECLTSQPEWLFPPLLSRESSPVAGHPWSASSVRPRCDSASKRRWGR
jgi:hypothetical protein